MTVQRCTRQFEHLGGALGEHRDGEDALAVGGAAEEPDEAVFEPLPRWPDAHAQHPCGTVNGGRGVGAGDHHPGVAGLRRWIDDGGVESGPGPQLPEPALADQGEARHGAAVGGGPEQDEVLDTEPVEQRVTVGDGEQSGLHLIEVVDHTVHRDDRVEHVALHDLGDVVGTAVELDLRPGFHDAPRPVRLGARLAVVGAPAGRPNRRDHAVVVARHDQRRVDQEMDAEVVAVEHDAHGVDEERDVVGDEHQHRTRGVPTVPLDIGREDPHEVLSRPASAAELEVGGGRGVEVVAATVVRVLVRQFGVVRRQQRPEQTIVGTTLGRQRFESGQDVGHVVVSSPSSFRTVASIGPGALAGWVDDHAVERARHGTPAVFVRSAHRLLPLGMLREPR